MRTKTKVLDRSMTLDPEKLNPGPGSYNKSSSSRVTKFVELSYGTSRNKRFDSYGIKIAY